MPRILRRDAERLLGEVAAECVFRCCDSRVITSMRGLNEAFGSMMPETFVYHVNPEKNDFGNWVRDVIGDAKLARDLLKARHPAEAARAVTDRMSFLESKLI